MEKEKNSIALFSSIMTVHDVASYLRLSEATVYQMARSGRIPVLHMGRIWRFKKENIDAWIDKSDEVMRKS